MENELGDPPAPEQPDDKKLSFIRRFFRWVTRRLDPFWDVRHLDEGDEAGDTHWLDNIPAPEDQAADEPEADGAAEDEAEQDPNLAWPEKRLNVVEQLWGEGYTMPGGEDYIKEHLRLLTLDKKMSLLLLGASLCGIGRTLVDETGVWVTGYEGDPELADLGKERAVLYAMQRRAPVKKADLATTQFKKKSFDVVLSFERLYEVENKKEMFANIVDSMRTDGELIYTDFVLPDTNPPGPTVNAWTAAQKIHPHLWPAEVTQAYLTTLNLDVRPYTDITKAYRNRVLMGWLNFLSTMTKPKLLKIADEVIAECEHWAKLITAIDSGELKVFQFHAYKLIDKKR